MTKPGFYHNLHSINHFSISDTPWFADLNLADKVTYITPRYEFGQAHLDGTALVLGRDLDETVANIARFSKKDAQTFRDWNARAEEITAKILIPERYAEPLPQQERDALLSRTAIGRDFLEVTQRQPLDVVEELFENEHVKLLFLFKVSLFGTWLTDTMSKTSPTGSVIRAFDLQTGYQLCQGGSFNLARGLMETFIAAGGTFQPQVSIDRIVVEGGRATGIALDRRPHGARLAIRGVAPSTCTRRSKDCSAASNCRKPSARSSTISNTPPGRCSGCITRCTRARASRRRRSIRMSIAR